MKPVRALILAAGKGTRLGDLSKLVPKPLMLINGKPILLHNIFKCEEAGIDSIFINLHYCADAFLSFFKSRPDLEGKLHYSFEKELLGTAGALKNLRAAFEGSTIVVIYGDNYSDIRLNAMIERHRELGAEMSIALFEKEDVSQSGVVACDDEGRIVEFIEKPTGQTTGNWVNAGIYIMEDSLLGKIPDGYCDFGRDVIPKWLEQGVRIYGQTLSATVVAVDTPLMFEEAGASLGDPTDRTGDLM